MKNKKFFIIALLMVVLLIGVGYANITNKTLEINGTATATPDGSNFVVKFKNETVPTTGGATATVLGDTSAEIEVTGLTAKGQTASATYTIVNNSEGLDALLSAVVTKKTDSDNFDVTYSFADTKLLADDETTLTVTVTLKNTPIDEDLTTSIKVDVTAKPQQAEENT